jgi:NAD(P) transhydrogenase subunit alpha
MEYNFGNIVDNVALFSLLIQVHPPSCSASSGLHGLTVFVLACFVGYYVVWKVTPALHAPLMSVTNAISSVIIVGAIFSVAHYFRPLSMIFGFIAIVLASINIFGGFTVTHRMLSMFRKKK